MSARLAPERLIFFALATTAALPLVVVPWIANQHALPTAAVLRIIGVSLLVGLAWLLRRRGVAGLGMSAVEFSLLAFALVLTASTLLSSDLELSWGGSYRRFEGLLTWLIYLLIFLAARLALNAERVKLLFEMIVWAALPISLLAVVQAAVSPVDGFRAQGTLGNPAFLGSYLVMVIPLAVFTALEGGRRQMMAGAAGASLGLAALYLSFTRGAWLALPFGLIILGIAISRRRRTGSSRFAPTAGLALLIAAVALVAAIGIGGPDYGLQRITSASDMSTGTTATRIEMGKGAIALIRERPGLGWGLETFRENFMGNQALAELETVFRRADRPHNQFLYLAYSAGLPGAAAYYFFILAFIVSAGREMRKGRDADLLAPAALAAVIAYSIQAEFLFSVVEVSPLVWLIAGGAMAVIRERRQSAPEISAALEPGDRPRSGALNRGLAITAVIAVCVTALWQIRSISADYYFQIGLPGRETGSAETIKNLETASRLGGPNRVYTLALGQAYFARGRSSRDRAAVDRAISVYEAETRRRSDDEIWYSLGDAHAFYGEHWDPASLDKALEAYSNAALLRPYFPYSYWEMGYIWAKKGDTRKAIDLYRRSLEIDPKNVPALTELGALYEQNGDLGEARSVYKKASALEPGNPSASAALTRLK